MTIEALAELIYRQYEGGDVSDDSAFEDTDFIKAVESARAYKILDDYRKAIKLEGERYINEAWLKSYTDIDVSYDAPTDTYYSMLPAKVLGLPKGQGLYFVSKMQDFTHPFAPFSTADLFILSSVLNLKNDTNIYYRSDFEKIYYINFDPDVTKVFIQLVPLVDDEIPDEFCFEIRELVLNQFLKPKQMGIEQDKVNDANPNRDEIRERT